MRLEAHQSRWKSSMALLIILSLCHPTMQAVTCWLGVLTPTQLTNNTVLHLRKGETMFIKCEENGPQRLSRLTCRSTLPQCRLNERSNTPLRYSWFSEAQDSGSIEIHGFLMSDDNSEMILQLAIEVHDLPPVIAPVDLTTTSPPASEQTTHSSPTTTHSPTISSGDPNAIQRGSHSSNDATTTAAPCESSVSKVAGMTLGLLIVVGVLGAMVLFLGISVIVMAVKLHQKKSVEAQAEEGVYRRHPEGEPTEPRVERDVVDPPLISRGGKEKEGGGANSFDGAVTKSVSHSESSMSHVGTVQERSSEADSTVQHKNNDSSMLSSNHGSELDSSMLSSNHGSELDTSMLSSNHGSELDSSMLSSNHGSELDTSRTEILNNSQS